MEKDMCKDQHMQVDAEEKAVPEVHMQRNVENMAKMEEEIAKEKNNFAEGLNDNEETNSTIFVSIKAI